MPLQKSCFFHEAEDGSFRTLFTILQQLHYGHLIEDSAKSLTELQQEYILFSSLSTRLSISL